MSELHRQAAWITEKVLKKQGSIRNLCYKDEIKKKAAVYALVVQTIKFKTILEEIINAQDSDLFRVFKGKESLLLVLVYDLLIGNASKEGFKGGGWAFKSIKQRKNSLEASFERIKIKRKVSDPALLVSIKGDTQYQLPRYVRANTIVTTENDVITVMQNQGYQLVQGLQQVLNSQDKKCFMKDQHIPNLLVFHPNIYFHDHLLYKEGKIVLQDKASCLPAYVLGADNKSLVLDCCAAPGNKTSHCIANMILRRNEESSRDRGKMTALDKDPVRAKTMTRNLKKLHCFDNRVIDVEVKNLDFLTVNFDEPPFNTITHIILDPSCSGSGIVKRIDDLLEDGIKEEKDKVEESKAEEKRLELLCDFQIRALLHAMSSPTVQKVVYSTCSIHEIENEHVVEEALKHMSAKFRLVDPLPGWTNRGEGPVGSLCLHASPQNDNTNGFFVALFERRNSPLEEDEKKETKTQLINNSHQCVTRGGSSSNSSGADGPAAVKRKRELSEAAQEKKKRKKKLQRKRKKERNKMLKIVQ